MKYNNNHGVYDHNSPNDQKAMFKAILLASALMIACLTVLTITGLYLKRLNQEDADLKARVEYIESGHSEIK